MGDPVVGRVDLGVVDTVLKSFAYCTKVLKFAVKIFFKQFI